MTRRQFPSNQSTQSGHWWQRLNIASQKFAVLLVFTAFLSGFGYVLLTNTTASEGLAIRKLQVQIDQMQTENEKLQLKAADMQSLSVADAASDALGLQPVDQFQVLAADGGSVARR
jgi:cell division protein FtsB